MASSATEKYYEYIVVGCGGIGSATLYWLSTCKGVDVLGLEQFKLGHDNGGSQDYSRIIRMMYHDTKYTKLVKEAYKCWEEVEAESGLQILYKTGGVQFAVKGTPGESGLEKYAAASKAEHIAFERVSGQQIAARFPGFAMSSDVVGLYEPTAGLVDAAVGNATHIQLAQAHGATVIDSCPVLKIDTLPSGEAKVFTTRGQFRCRRVIITAGAWINNVLGTVGIHIPVSVTQEQVTYFATPNMKLYTKSQLVVQSSF
ncbi:PREDICTED: monomeric sarcosine oxidase-like [Priapulus caudatus]|uniref:Monomeric sarcosine oxidase-like n=1 Tax=Priapulus caudatus TaxID=37621 RepID=A0ABM1EGT4_PRICU|nr:PREDICTED: monomeric sarcosine oxidase-like [Priapulus caudatus]